MEKIGRFAVFAEKDSVPWAKLHRAILVEEETRRRVYLRIFPFTLPAGLTYASHLAVADVIAVEEEGSKGLWAEEYFPGSTVSTLVRQCNRESFPLPRDHAIHITERVLAGFENHPFAFPHPHLIYLSFEGEVKGSAVPLGRILVEHRPESLIPYLSPQHIETREWKSTDQVYAAGALFFELLTGRPLPAAAVEEKRVETVTSAPGMDGDPLPKDLVMIILRALAQNERERYPSLKEMRESIGKLITDGTYAPTTFNLAFFMNTLFRDDINVEEKLTKEEDEADIEALFAPPPEPEPQIEPGAQEERFPGPPQKKAPVFFIAAAVVAVLAIIAVFIFTRSKPAPPVESPPAPAPAQPSVQLKEKLAEKQALIDQLEAQKKASADELERLKAEQKRKKNPEIARKLREKEREDKKLQDSIQKAKKSLPPVQAPKEPASDTGKAPAVNNASKSSGTAQPSAAPPTASKEEQEEKKSTAPESVPVGSIPSSTAKKEAPAPSPPEKPKSTVKRGALVDPTEVDQMPILIDSSSKPRYPPMAKRRRIQGTVYLNVLINETGKAVDFKVIRAPGGKAGLDRAAIKAVKKWKFQPALKEGVPVKTWQVIPVLFKL